MIFLARSILPHHHLHKAPGEIRQLPPVCSLFTFTSQIPYPSDVRKTIPSPAVCSVKLPDSQHSHVQRVPQHTLEILTGPR